MIRAPYTGATANQADLEQFTRGKKRRKSFKPKKKNTRKKK